MDFSSWTLQIQTLSRWPIQSMRLAAFHPLAALGFTSLSMKGGSIAARLASAH